MYRHIRWLAAFAVLAFTSLVTRAEDPANEFNDNLNTIITRKPDPVNDYALGWLQQIFGDFIFFPWGGSTAPTGIEATLVSHAVGFTNVVALILGIVIVSYVFMAGAINTAAQGEVLGKQWSKVWLPIRTAISFGLITPVVGVGGGVVSLVQAFVLSLIIIGSNAATLLWEKVGEEISGGTVLVANHEPVGMQPALTMFKALTCAQAAYDHSMAKKHGDTAIATITLSEEGAPFIVNGPLSSAKFPDNKKATYIKFGNSSHECGHVVLTPSDKSAGDAGDAERITKKYHRDAIDVGYSAARSEVFKLLNSLVPVVDVMTKSHKNGGLGGGENMENQMRSDKDSAKAPIESAAKLYATAARSFSTGLPKSVKDAIGSNESLADAWKKDITRGGWGAAGMWFFEISRMQTLSDTVINRVAGSPVSVEEMNFCGWLGIKKLFNDCEDYTKRATNDIQLGTDIIHKLALQQPFPENASGLEVAQNQLDASTSGNLSGGILDGLAVRMSQAILNWAASDGHLGGKEGMGGEGTTTSASAGLASPFITVTNIGNTLNKTAGFAWTGGLILKGVGGIAGSIPLVGKMTGGATEWIGMTLVGIIMSLVSMGFILSFLIPFMPIVTWVRLIASYLLTTIEAVVAAPLAVIMMATPEGEGISGTRLERAIQLLASVILKPTLMIIGLVAAVLLGFVTFGILNLMFWQVAAAVTDSGLFELIAILVTYTMAAFQICKASIMIMHKIPDQILDWMAGGVGGRAFGDDAEAGIERGMGETKGAMGSVAGTLTKPKDRGSKKDEE